MIKTIGVVEQKQQLNRIKVFILRGIDSLLAGIERKAGVAVQQVDSSNKGFSMKLDGSFRNSSVLEMLWRIVYRALDMILSIIGAYLDCATRVQNEANMTGFPLVKQNFFEDHSPDCLLVSK